MSMVLVTGSSGFLGGYILDSLASNNVETICVSRRPPKNKALNYQLVDLSKAVPDFSGINIKTVIHNAGVAHDVNDSIYESEDYFDTNVNGTKNLLLSLSDMKLSLRQFVFISTVSVYGQATGNGIHEESSLDGSSPYAKSKIEAENLVTEWSTKNSINLLIVRLPLIIGRNPKGNLQRLQELADKRVQLRICPDSSSKSIVHAKDVAELVTSDILMNGVFNLTDGRKYSFSEIYTHLSALNPRVRVKIPLPTSFLNFLGVFGDIVNRLGIHCPINSRSVRKIQSDLTFSSAKAVNQLDWNPQSALRDE